MGQSRKILSPSTPMGESIMARVLTAEQKRRRAQTARKNGAKGRGPKTEETKLISSRNSMTHGCYAVVHSLADEPVSFAVGLRERWFADKKPETREEEHLVEEMFRGDLMAMRYHRAMDRALIRQQEMNLQRWEEVQQETVAELKQTLVTDPAENFLTLSNCRYAVPEAHQ
jgi:hypothetical protein